MKQTPKRLLIDIPIDLHKEIKVRAAVKNITLKVWVLRAIFEAIKTEKSYE